MFLAVKQDADGLPVTFFRFQDYLPAGAARGDGIVYEIFFRPGGNGKGGDRLIGISGIGIEPEG